MRIPYLSAVLLLLLAVPTAAQVTMTGRTWMPRHPGSEERFAFTTITGFANRPGLDNQALSYRTWETYPSGWYLFSGNAGNYTLVFSNPAHFMRPILRTNLFLEHGETMEKNLAPEFDYAFYYEGAWDEKPASDYYQTFTATGTSITHVGFMLATDGVDGEGPDSQDLQVSIHRSGEGTPDTWEQVGPSMPVLDVNCGGSVNRPWSAGWNSGEVPTVAGETYAVRIQSMDEGGTFQALWSREDQVKGRCYRVAPDSSVWVENDLWMAVAGDSDGLLIPFNKRVHDQHYDLAGFGSRWTQTWIAQGEGLASAILFVAVATTQPVLVEQRAIVQIREGGPDGPVLYPAKIAKGQSTATAESGVFGVTFAPGELPLVPGETYAMEFIALGEGSGFNPWRKHPPDEYPHGVARLEGEEVDYDLDLQIIEYASDHGDMTSAVEGDNLLANGDFNDGMLDPVDSDNDKPEDWQRFSLDPGTTFWYPMREEIPNDRYIKVIGGAISGRTVDGGYVQQAAGLSNAETYRLTGKVRSTFAVDSKHQCFVGLDPTGQMEDAEADSIRWDVVPDIHGLWLEYVSDPVRPATDSISVWLRGRTTEARAGTFEADFDDFALRQVKTTVE